MLLCMDLSSLSCIQFSLTNIDKLFSLSNCSTGQNQEKICEKRNLLYLYNVIQTPGHIIAKFSMINLFIHKKE